MFETGIQRGGSTAGVCTSCRLPCEICAPEPRRLGVLKQLFYALKPAATTHSSSLSTAQSISEIDIVLPVLPVMATAILCVWATHTTVVSPEVAASTAEPPEVVAPTLIPKVFSETTPVPKSVPELTPALESVLEPAPVPEPGPVPDSAPAPPKAAAALFPELVMCPVTYDPTTDTNLKHSLFPDASVTTRSAVLAIGASKSTVQSLQNLQRWRWCSPQLPSRQGCPLMNSSSVLTWSWRLSVNPLSYPSRP